MANKLFISEAYIKDNSTVNVNVDAKFLRASVMDAQVTRIQTLLGTKLYKKLDSLLPTDITLPANAAYRELMDDYVAPALLQWSLVELIPLLRFKMTQKSVSAESSANGAPSDLEDVKFLMSKVENKAEFLNKRALDFLTAHASSYPEYLSCETGSMPAGTAAYFCGTQFGSGRASGSNPLNDRNGR